MAVAGKVAITLSTENGGAWSADVTYDRLVAVKHNNNLYISRKTVANIEPPNDEFWFLALEGFGGDDVQALIDHLNELSDLIQEIINGTTQVGNAKTLDGFSANTNGKKGIVSIVDDYGVMEVGRAIDFHTADGQDFAVRLYITDDGKIQISDSNGNGTYVGTLSDLANYLPLTGGTVANNNYVPLVVKNNSNDGGTWLRFDYSNEALGYLGFGSKDVLLFKTGGQTANHNILHTGNKPTGTYTGNGSAEQRVINIGGIGDVALVTSMYGTALVSASGGFASDVETITPFSSEFCFVQNGNMCMNSVDDRLNRDGVTYTYRVL